MTPLQIVGAVMCFIGGIIFSAVADLAERYK
jgi:hypothetical protein